MNEISVEMPIFAEDLKRRIDTKVIGKKIFAFEKLSSTNNFAKRLIQSGEGEGTLVIANHQTSGRGRYDRTWHAPANLGLWFSIILRPLQPREKLGFLSLLAAVAVARSIEAMTPLIPELKWPNDVLIDLKKACGILIESQLWKKGFDSFVLGIGVNVNQLENDFPEDLHNLATSLRLQCSERVNRAELLCEILKNLEYYYLEFTAGNLNLIVEEWKRACPFFDQQVIVKNHHSEVCGKFEDLDDHGRMVLRLRNGAVRHISAGEPILARRGEICYS